jgi:hypothetical protein
MTMKKSYRLLPFSILAATFVTSSLFGMAHAQSVPVSDEQIVRIRASCVSAKNTLNQLHASDALLRVNRGQLYESMSSKIMTRFNSRAQSNRYNVDNLVTVTQSYGTQLATFRVDYQAYEEQLSTALHTDCIKEPVAFYDAVASARAKRTQVHVDVIKLHQYIDEYQSNFDDFVTAFNAGGAKK